MLLLENLAKNRYRYKKNPTCSKFLPHKYLEVYLWWKQNFFTFLFSRNFTKCEMWNWEYSGKWCRYDKWSTICGHFMFLCGIKSCWNQLVDSAMQFIWLFIIILFFMNQIHQIVQVLNMIAKFPETGITSGCCSPKVMSTSCVVPLVFV